VPRFAVFATSPPKQKGYDMALTQGAFQAYDFNRMVVEFTMMNGDATVHCAVSTGALDDLDRPFKATSAQREAQFMRLRERIEEQIERRFLAAAFEGKRSEVILRTIDFIERKPN
jgi:hypothetical protein